MKYNFFRVKDTDKAEWKNMQNTPVILFSCYHSMHVEKKYNH